MREIRDRITLRNASLRGASPSDRNYALLKSQEFDHLRERYDRLTSESKPQIGTIAILTQEKSVLGKRVREIEEELTTAQEAVERHKRCAKKWRSAKRAADRQTEVYREEALAREKLGKTIATAATNMTLLTKARPKKEAQGSEDTSGEESKGNSDVEFP